MKAITVLYNHRLYVKETFFDVILKNKKREKVSYTMTSFFIVAKRKGV